MPTSTSSKKQKPSLFEEIFGEPIPEILEEIFYSPEVRYPRLSVQEANQILENLAQARQERKRKKRLAVIMVPLFAMGSILTGAIILMVCIQQRIKFR